MLKPMKFTLIPLTQALTISRTEIVISSGKTLAFLIITLLLIALCSSSTIAAPRGHTPTAQDKELMEAAMIGDMATVQALIDQGVSPNAHGKYGKSSLMFAIEEGNEEITEYLISKGADVNARSIPGCTALTFAAEGGYPEITRLLLSKGAKTYPKNRHGWGALMFATVYNHVELMKLLIDAGANVNCSDKDGTTL